MNILFIGNSLIWSSLNRIGVLLSQTPGDKVYMKIIYIAGGRINTYVNNFDNSMTNIFVPVRIPENAVVTFTPGNGILNKEVFPNISIKDTILERKWDKIVTCGHSGTISGWRYDIYKNYYTQFFNLIREYSDAEIYWVWSFVPELELIDKKKYSDFAKTREDIYSRLNEVDEQICLDNDVKPVKLRQAYEELVNAIPNGRHLIVDHIHPDKGIGKYFCAAYFYTFFFKDYYHMDISDMIYHYNAEKYKYVGSSLSCISVDKETKELADGIIHKIFEKNLCETL